MKKVIIFCRCSTLAQDITSQKNETILYAKSLGFCEEQFIHLGGVGLSAYKVDSLYIESINQLKKYIISDTIDSIVVYHLNRLARNEVIALEIKQLCVEHKVNIIVKEPQIKLLNDDKTLNEGFELAYSLFCTLNTQAVRELKVKTKRGKEYKKSLGKYVYVGGGIPLGYVVENDVITIDEDKASVVRYIFDLCIQGYSFSQIITELVESRKVDKISRFGVYSILHKSAYFDDTYPPIIDKDTYMKAQEILSSNILGNSKSSKIHHFCNRLIRCSCGYGYSVYKNLYVCCRKYEKKYQHNKGILIEVIDGIVFKLVNEKIIEQTKKDNEQTKKQLVKKIDSLNQKTIKISTQIGNFKSKYDRLFDGYVDGIIDKNTYNIKKQELGIKENELKDKLTHLQNELEHITNVFCNQKYFSLYDTTNAIEVQKYIRQYVSSIVLDNTTLLTITFKDNTIFQCYYNGKLRKNKISKDIEHTQGIDYPIIKHKGETFEIIKKG